MTTEPVKKGGGSSFILLLTVAVVLISAAVIYNLNQKDKSLGKPLPTFEAEGWLNGNAPTADDLKGKVLVVDAFAHWCGPCIMAAPEMVELHQKYAPEGVLFIGLTSEKSDKLSQTKAFLKKADIPWLTGYGASSTLRKLNNKYIPHVWVFNREGRIIFSRSNPPIHKVEAAIEKALSGV